MSKPFLILTAAAAAVSAWSTGATASDGEGEPRAASDAHFVAMEAIETPIVGSNRIEGSLHVKVVLDAKDASTADTLDARLPELRSHLLGATLEFSRLYASGNSPVNAELLRTELTAALNEAAPGAARILLVEVAARAA